MESPFLDLYSLSDQKPGGGIYRFVWLLGRLFCVGGEGSWSIYGVVEGLGNRGRFDLCPSNRLKNKAKTEFIKNLIRHKTYKI